MSDTGRPLPAGWDRVGDGLEATFRFADFVDAFGFMTQVAIEAERRAHHPEWSNVYGTVKVRLTTHDANDGAGGLTELDHDLAEEMSRLAARFD